MVVARRIAVECGSNGARIAVESKSKSNRSCNHRLSYGMDDRISNQLSLAVAIPSWIGAVGLPSAPIHEGTVNVSLKGRSGVALSMRDGHLVYLLTLTGSTA